MSGARRNGSESAHTPIILSRRLKNPTGTIPLAVYEAHWSKVTPCTWHQLSNFMALKAVEGWPPLQLSPKEETAHRVRAVEAYHRAHGDLPPHLLHQMTSGAPLAPLRPQHPTPPVPTAAPIRAPAQPAAK